MWSDHQRWCCNVSSVNGELSCHTQSLHAINNTFRHDVLGPEPSDCTTQMLWSSEVTDSKTSIQKGRRRFISGTEKRVKRRITRGRSGARLSFKVVLKPTQTMLWINIVPPEPHTHTPVLVSHQTQDYYNITVFKATQMVTNQTIEQTSVSLLLQSGSRLVHREQCAVDEDESIISRRSWRFPRWPPICHHI